MCQIYVIASLSLYGPGKHGWIRKDGSISRDRDGVVSFDSSAEAESKMKEWAVPMGHVIRFA